jgi:hypothetical protein
MNYLVRVFLYVVLQLVVPQLVPPLVAYKNKFQGNWLCLL